MTTGSGGRLLIDLSHTVRHGMVTYEGLYAAEYLADAGAALVGIDSFNIDDTDGGERPVHTTLLGRGIPIVEHMSGLEQLRGRRFRFSAVPVKVEGLGSFPVRAFALAGGTGISESEP